MAKKKKGFGELLHQRRQVLNQQELMENLENRVIQGFEGKVGKVLWNEGETKMSEVLEDFVKPYLDSVKTTERRQKLLAIAAFAWNIALLPEDQQQAELDNTVQALTKSQSAQVQQDTLGILEAFIERKQTHFAHHRRYILDYELKESPDEFFLSVVFTDL